MNDFPEELFDRARADLDAGRLDTAEDSFLQVLARAPGHPPTAYNLGLIYKWRREWQRCLEYNQLATRDAAPHDPAWWNLGIAATAIGAWDVARRAWRGYGIDLPDGEGPIDGDLGIAAVRVALDTSPEVVWCRRIDPARARIISVPTPESGHRWGDLVLHDGSPEGARLLHGRERPVFNEISRVEPSTTPTVIAEVECAQPEDSHALEEAFAAQGRAAEDWTGSLEMVCAHCSAGTPHERHEPGTAPWVTRRRFGMASPAEAAHRLLHAWMMERPHRRQLISFDPTER